VGQRVRHGVEASWLVLDSEVEPEQLTDPLVLWNRRQALVEKELQVVMVSANKKMSSP
jgi:hypothetical protein